MNKHKQKKGMTITWQTLFSIWCHLPMIYWLFIRNLRQIVWFAAMILFLCIQMLVISSLICDDEIYKKNAWYHLNSSSSNNKAFSPKQGWVCQKSHRNKCYNSDNEKANTWVNRRVMIKSYKWSQEAHLSSGMDLYCTY